MSYREENGQVVLTMSREDYERLLIIFGMASARVQIRPGLFGLDTILGVMNRLNSGNPNYTPYQVADKS
jgi:hypothetical protein